MSKNYDNWERLVAAVLKREELWQLFHQDSKNTSITSSNFSSGERMSNDLSINHQIEQYYESIASESQKSSSMQIRVGKERREDSEQHRSKSKRLLKALLSRGKPKKEDKLYTYFDEY
ncbi:hypothetical protein BUALT_Bualt06G0096400 [Buddleja alternifolia]|uniref:Uncharacterized protein n=1 Tax=Buddleja alternifolia TaxID=168488 RepID=A0AAV6XFB7_9LAMI|nr:hypothetical protein BUALT_Bualt06G0096400 [Buddleja alternifolia]